MDLTRDVRYGRERPFSFNTVEQEDGSSVQSGVVIKRVEYGDLEVVGYTEKRSLDDGNDAADVFLGRRRVTLTGEVYGATKGELFDRLREMRFAINPRLAYDETPGDKGYLPLAYFEPTAELATYPTGLIQLMLLCHSIGGVNTNFDRDKQGGADTDPLTAPYQVSFEAVDPRVYLLDRAEEVLEGDSGTLTLTNRGGHPATVNLILVHTASPTHAFEFTINIGGLPVTLTFPIGDGTQVLRFDGLKKVVTMQQDDVEVLAMSTLDLESEWPTIPRGETSATWSLVRDDAVESGTGSGILRSTSRLWYRETFS